MFSRMRSGRTTSPSTSPEADEHVVQECRRRGQGHPLDRRVADVPLVPQRLVLHARERVAPEQAREPGQPLCGDGVALVGMALEPFWPGANGSGAPDLGVLEVAHLGREPLDRVHRSLRSRRGTRRGGRSGCSPGLRGDRVPQASASIVGSSWSCPDGPRDLARGKVVRREAQPIAVTRQLERPRCELEPEC